MTVEPAAVFELVLGVNVEALGVQTATVVIGTSDGDIRVDIQLNGLSGDREVFQLLPRGTLYFAVGGAENGEVPGWLSNKLDELRENLLRPGACYSSVAIVYADEEGELGWASPRGGFVALGSPSVEDQWARELDRALRLAQPGVAGVIQDAIDREPGPSAGEPAKRWLLIVSRMMEEPYLGPPVDIFGIHLTSRGCELPSGETVPPAYGYTPYLERSVCMDWPTGDIAELPVSCARLDGSDQVRVSIDGVPFEHFSVGSDRCVIYLEAPCLGQTVEVQGGVSCPD